MNDQRSIDQLREHYQVEKELAEKLRNSSRGDRQHLYSSVYAELFRRLPDHPQLTRKPSRQELITRISYQLRNIYPFLRHDTTFLELGAGDCVLSMEVAKLVHKVYATDVAHIGIDSEFPRNFMFFLSDGYDVPLGDNSVDVAYSYQLMEHLHPDDALEQLQNIYRVVKSGGTYICDTPNRLSGPHDISKSFDIVASGLHLKEYTNGELCDLFNCVGFSRVRVHLRVKCLHMLFPVVPFSICEQVLSKAREPIRRKLVSRGPLRFLLGIRVVGTK